MKHRCFGKNGIAWNINTKPAFHLSGSIYHKLHESELMLGKRTTGWIQDGETSIKNMTQPLRSLDHFILPCVKQIGSQTLSKPKIEPRCSYKQSAGTSRTKLNSEPTRLLDTGDRSQRYQASDKIRCSRVSWDRISSFSFRWFLPR